MKKIIVLCLFSLMIWNFQPGFAQTPLQLCAAHYPPWIISENDSSSGISGITIDVMTELFSRADVPVQLAALPFSRCLNYTEMGKNYDGCFMTIKNAERESYARFTESYVSVPTYLFYHQDRFDEFQWDKWEDLQGYSLGIQRGFRYGQEFTKAVERLNLDIKPTNDISQSIKKVIAGRIDFVLVNRYRLHYLISQNPQFADQLKMAEKRVGTGKFYLAISKKSPAADMVPKLNDVIRQMKTDGSLEAIINSSLKTDK